MKRTLLDTDTLTYFLQGNPRVAARAAEHIRLYQTLNISLITEYEVLHGLYYKDARVQLPRFELMLTRQNVLAVTKESVRLSAAIYANLKKQGLKLEHTDVLIAHGLELATNNTRHFERIEGLHLTNWTQP